MAQALEGHLIDDLMLFLTTPRGGPIEGGMSVGEGTSVSGSVALR